MSVTIRAVFLRGTNKAIMVDHEGTEMWLPRSQLLEAPEGMDRHGQYELKLTDWIAKEKGITLDEERYEAEGSLIWDRTESGGELATARDHRTAQMIAAALNMTIGKV